MLVAMIIVESMRRYKMWYKRWYGHRSEKVH